MPLHEYDKFFGGKKGSAAQARANMHRTYGKKDGESVFQATIAKRRRKQGKKPKLADRFFG